MNHSTNNSMPPFTGTPIVDLHVHSTCSDGTFTPTELVDYALEKGLTGFALTDHDTTDGLEEAMEYAKDKGIEVIPGIELSTEYESKDIHILGLYIDYNKKEFKDRIQAFVDSRILRNMKMCDNLREAGIDITYEKLLAEFPGAVITRSHYARFLLNHGYIKSMAEAFERYVGDNCPYYVPREKVTPAQAVELILKADGIPILAHPTLYHMSDRRLEKLVVQLKEAGLMGIEAVYSTYTAGEERQMRELAKRYNLLISGGSDFHGSNKPKLDLAVGYGKLHIPASILDDIKKTRISLVFCDLDGTLLNKECQITPRTRDAIAKMTAKGHKLILTSGRPLDSILEVKKQADLDYPGMLIISNNGSIVYDCDAKKRLVDHRVTCDELRFLTNEARKMGVYCHGYTDTHIVTTEETKELASYTSRIHLPVTVVEDIADALPDGSSKLMVINLDDHQLLEDFRAHIADFCKGRIQAVFSNPTYLELLPINAGKGNGVRYVCEHFHVPVNHTYGCGDAENDISMLEAVGTAVAMQNADDHVKKIADIITEDDNNNDGLVPLFESLA